MNKFAPMLPTGGNILGNLLLNIAGTVLPPLVDKVLDNCTNSIESSNMCTRNNVVIEPVKHQQQEQPKITININFYVEE